MSEGQYSCPAYYHADYIIIQAEKYRKFFDASLPQEKLIPLGTPKYDKVLRICNNPPQPPTDWQQKMEGKKVYFYNTSLSGMLANTAAFLKKMEYVFRCFMNREDACLLWRPHPLMESTFDSMRPAYKPIYEALKNLFITYDLGIYDVTPDITNTIALCDAYIDDAGTSVISLFGIAGKPIFILDNNINTAPQGDDWRGTVIKPLVVFGDNSWMITQGNKLYHSPENDYNFQYVCDLNKYAGGNYYFQVITIDGMHYACPSGAQDILVVSEKGVERRIELKRESERNRVFYRAISCGRYLFLIPNNYSAIVKYDTVTDEVMYIRDYQDVFKAEVSGEKHLGGFNVLNGYLYIASPVDNRILIINATTGAVQLQYLGVKNTGGCAFIAKQGEELWLLPYEGCVITRWNPGSGEIWEYDNCPEGLQCKRPVHGYPFNEKPFYYPAFVGEDVYLPPCYGNMYVKLNRKTGAMTQWIPPFEQPENVKNGYYTPGAKSYFLGPVGEEDSPIYRLFLALDKRLYDVNLETKEYQEIEIAFEAEELLQNVYGFWENSEWLQYACEENAFNSLKDFLDGSIMGSSFDRERQIRAFGSIAANHDGTCGEKVYRYVGEKVGSEIGRSFT